MSHGEAETAEVARQIAAGFRGGEVVLLTGELGAGKTAFVRGLARGLAADPEEVASPTFVLLTAYPGRLTLHHADLYRLRGDGDERELGLEELPGPKGVLAVEWADRLGALPWAATLRVSLSHAGDDERLDSHRARRVRRLTLVLLAASLVACPQPSARQPHSSASAKPLPRGAGNRLNVLLVTIDTLRADHLGAYGYRRATSPNIDALSRRGVTFEEAYTYWPKTRGSFVALHTGRLAAQSGYGKTHPLLVDFNPTLASVLQEAGYDTQAVVDNPNVAASLGYAKGFARYRETWEEERLTSEMERTRAITADAVAVPGRGLAERPFFLWLHYVNPHAPYEPPAPFDEAFLDDAAARGPVLAPVAGFHGGVPRQWARPGATGSAGTWRSTTARSPRSTPRSAG